jgi:multicomponent Na+:H+ antiporter subunit E
MKKYMFYGLLMAITWFFVKGAVDTLTAIQGLLIGLSLAYSFRRFYPGEFHLRAFRRIPFIVRYILSFLRALLVSNLDTAYRVLHPGMPAEPGFFRYSVELEHPAAITVLANSITLTPGTLVVDYLEEEKEMKIHCLNLENPEKIREDIKQWEKTLEKAFGERR